MDSPAELSRRTPERWHHACVSNARRRAVAMGISTPRPHVRPAGCCLRIRALLEAGCTGPQSILGSRESRCAGCVTCGAAVFRRVHPPLRFVC